MTKQRTHHGNKYAHLTQPQATLDFHGKGILSEAEIRMEAGTFVEDCVRRNLHRVLIITGKGMHSKQGPVIGPLLRDFLPSLPGVQYVLTARRDRGGEGALEITLA